MTLRETRCAFTLALARLILYARESGLDVALDDARRSEEEQARLVAIGAGSRRSVHPLGLAADLLLYRGGAWIESGDDPVWADLHDYWCCLGGAAPVRQGRDMGHFSFAWEGRA